MRRGGTGLLLTLVAFGFVGLEATARGGEPDPVQLQAAQAIERVGGWASPGFLFYPPGMVTVIEGSKATDEDMVYVSCFKDVAVLVLDDTRVTDRGLERTGIDGSKHLKVLSLAHTQITDAGLVHLEGLKNLKELDLAGTPITDAGLEHLKELKRLRSLTLTDTQVSAEGIKRLRRSLWWCRIR